MSMHPFDSFPNTLDLGTLEKMGEPLHRVLAEFIHGCSADASTRTVAVTTLVTSCWQLAGRGMSHRLPSLFLLNATGSTPDPIDVLAARLVNERDDTGPRMHREGAFALRKPEEAPTSMASAILEKHNMGEPKPHDLQSHQLIEERFFAAQKTGFGSSRSRPYSAAWHETFDLLTKRNDEIILRLEGPDDCLTLRQHLLEDAEKLLCPIGYGAGLVPVEKHVSISGSLTPDQWDEVIATKMVALGLPFLFLPHVGKQMLVTDNLPALDSLASMLPKAFHAPVEEPANLLPVNVFEHYGRHLRKRLRELPGTYEYVMQRMVRQLFPVCSRLANWTGQRSGATAAEIEALFLDLYGHTLRGMVIGVTGLAWHGLGFDTGAPRAKAVKLLKYLRDKGAMTKSDLMRGAHLTKDQRDVLLERFAAEDLVRVDGKFVIATTYPEFVEALYAREAFPEPGNYWAEIVGGTGDAA